LGSAVAWVNPSVLYVGGKYILDSQQGPHASPRVRHVCYEQSNLMLAHVHVCYEQSKRNYASGAS